MNTSTKNDIERLLEVIAVHTETWERSSRELALQNKVLFESLSPEGQAQVRSIWDEPNLAKKAALLALQNKVLFESLSPEGQAQVRSAWSEFDPSEKSEN